MRYKRENEPLSSLTHLIGAGMAIGALVLLVVFAAINKKTRLVVGFSVFGSAMILLYLSSAIYHFLCETRRAKKIFQKIDHIMIYFLIAATYTPICFILPNRGFGWTIFGIIWGLAIFGAILKAVGGKVKNVFSTIMYLAMGWLGVWALSSLLEILPKYSVLWLVGGGMAYSIGVLFFAIDNYIPRTRWFGMHEVFHIFVIAGSFSHFWFMFRYVLHA